MIWSSFGCGNVQRSWVARILRVASNLFLWRNKWTLTKYTITIGLNKINTTEGERLKPPLGETIFSIKFSSRTRQRRSKCWPMGQWRTSFPCYWIREDRSIFEGDKHEADLYMEHILFNITRTSHTSAILSNYEPSDIYNWITLKHDFSQMQPSILYFTTQLWSNNILEKRKNVCALPQYYCMTRQWSICLRRWDDTRTRPGNVILTS